MRTTLTLDPDVARLIEEEAHKQRLTIKQVVNDALRRGLAPRPAQSRKRYRVKAHTTAFQPGIDLSGFNRLVDELEDEAVVAKVRRGR
jgi:hypothetical protein